MNNKSKLFFAFGAGALLGAGIVALLTTDKGKAIVEKAKGKINDLSDELKDQFKKFEKDVADINNTDEKANNSAI